MNSTVPEGSTPEVAIVGGHARVQGSFISGGTLIVEGEFSGSVQCPHLVIMERGKVEGFVEVQDAEVWGVVGGFAKAGKMVCRRTSRVVGCVMVRSVALEPGMILEGTIIFERPEENEREREESRERESRFLKEESPGGDGTSGL